MPRKQLIKQNIFPYHITIRSNNKDWFKANMNTIWELFQLSLSYANRNIPAQVHAAVLMGNHYHLLVSTPNSDIDKFMFFLNKNFSNRIKNKTAHINHKFGGRYRWSIVDNRNYLYNVIKYIYQNPIRAKLSSRCEQYPYSTFGKSQIKNITLYKVLDESTAEFSNWVNECFSKDTDEVIRKGLKKDFFNIRKKEYSKSVECEMTLTVPN